MLNVINILLPFLFLIFIIAIVTFFIVFKHKPLHLLLLIFKDIYTHIKNKKNEENQVFPFYGFWLYCGLGGSGKTLSMVQKISELKEKYPKLWVVTNFTTVLADERLNSWEDLINIENPHGSEYGVLFAFDEIHLTLNSDNYRKRPEQLLEYISQQRKLRKLILGSSQVFMRVDKVLREQSNLVIDCRTYFKRWNFQRAYRTEDYLINGELRDKGSRKRDTVWKKNFIATDKIRSLYDTYEVMKPLIKKDNEENVISLKATK